MAKKFLVMAFTALVLASVAGVTWAANPDTGPGCGLGKLAWADYHGQKQIAPQVMMATTNGTFGSQTFGISSGTSGCTNDGVVMESAKLGVFAVANYDNLSQDMAQGGGEHLASLATLMGIPEEDHAAFFAMTQKQYLALSRKGDASPVELVKALEGETPTSPTHANSSTSQ